MVTNSQRHVAVRKRKRSRTSLRKKDGVVHGRMKLYRNVGAGADPGRNLTRAQPKAHGRGYMGVENISEQLTKRASWSDFYY